MVQSDEDAAGRLSNVPWRRPWRTLGLAATESRPVVQIIFMARFAAGSLLAGHSVIHLARMLAGLTTWLAVTAAVYLFNGVMDVTEDKKNGSRRPIASGRLPRRTAAWLTAWMALISAACGMESGIEIPVIVMLVLGYAYSGPPWPAKRYGPTASIVIAGLGFVTVWAGAMVGGRLTVAAKIFAVIMSAWMGLVGSLVKDLGDVVGDAFAGRRTSCVIYGRSRVARLSSILAISTAGAGVAAAATYASALTPAMSVLSVASVVVVVLCLRLAASPGSVEPRSPYKAFMVAQYAFVAATILASII